MRTKEQGRRKNTEGRTKTKNNKTSSMNETDSHPLVQEHQQ